MDIVEEIRNDPEKGARSLEAEYRAGLLTLARRLCRNDCDAEELVNRTFAEVIANIDSYAEQSAFFGWMSKILVNLNAKDIRRKSNERVVYPGELPELVDENAENQIFHDVDASLLRDAIDKLPKEDKDVLLLHYFLDMPVTQMAKILLVPCGTIKSRLHHARKALAAKLGVAARKPGGKAVILALLLCGLTALGAGIAGMSRVASRVSSPAATETSVQATSDSRQAEASNLSTFQSFNFSTSSNLPQSPSGVAGSPQRGAEGGSDFTQGETMNLSITARTTAALATALAVQASAPTATFCDTTPRRPMALMIMIDGLRADAVETAYMPNLAKLRNGEWQTGYGAAWSLDAQIVSGTVPAAGPNYVSIATGVGPAKHGVTSNANMASGDYATYPTWLARVVGADPTRSALFLSTWANNASIGPTNTVTTTINANDAENAANLATMLASASAPDATMYFIEAPDIAAKSSGYYPMGDSFRAALLAADGYIGGCLDAIANRPTFADEDWLILLTSGYGGYAKTHTDIVNGRHAHTVPLIIAGRNVTSGRIPGQPYNMDVAASALAHFGVATSGLDAVARDNTAAAEPSRSLSDGLAAYLPFDSSATENAVSGSSVAPASNGSVALIANGMFGSCLDFPSGTGANNYVKLVGSDSDSIAYENGNTCFAATIWVKMSPPAYDPPIFANKNWSGNAKGFLLFAGSSSQVKYTSINGVNPCLGGFLNAGSGSGRIDMGCMDFEGTNDWTFYAVTRDAAGIITLYQGRSDGTLDWVSGELSGSTMVSGQPFYIGNDATGNYYNGQAVRAFVGEVDDFGLWTRALSHGEIRRIFSAGRAGVALGSLASVPAGPATATWTGTVSSDPTVAGNWSGNAVPSFDTAVTVPSTAANPIAMGAALPCKSIFFDNATLCADIGEPGLDAAKIVPGSSIDLDGHVLRLRAGSAYLPLTVTDTSADIANPGELHLDDTGHNITNTTMALSCNLRFFKSGAGKFTASASESYTGGIAVEEGTFVMARIVSGPIRVEPGATLDQYGFSLSANPVTLAGGTITSTKLNAGATLPSAMALTSDSSIVHDNNGSNHDFGVPANAIWNLGGQTLTVFVEGNDGDFNMEGGSTITNGTLRFSVETTTYNPQGKAWVGIVNLNGRDGLNLDLGASYLRLKYGSGFSTVNSTVHDFTCDPLPDSNVYSAHLLEVYGTYTPPSTSMGFNTKLMDGATLNLASASVPWDCAYANVGGYSSGSDKGCALSFADGAVITVNLAGRTDIETIANNRGLVATWATTAIPAASTTFVLDEATASSSKGYYLRKTDDGLQLRKKDAFTIVIR
jgi:RNA polymerase sigma factor (sigma-70 family)